MSYDPHHPYPDPRYAHDPQYQQQYRQWLQQHSLQMAVVEQERYLRRRGAQARHQRIGCAVLAGWVIGPFVLAFAMWVAVMIGPVAVILVLIMFVLGVAAMITAVVRVRAERWRDR